MSEIAEGKLAWPQAHNIGMRLAYKIGLISTKRKNNRWQESENPLKITPTHAHARTPEETIGKTQRQ